MALWASEQILKGKEEPQAKLKLRAQVLHGKATSLVEKPRARWPLFVHPSHPAIAVRRSRRPFHFVCFFRTEHQLLPSKLVSCKLYDLGDVLVIISYIVVYWEKVVGRVTRDFWQFWGTLCSVTKFKLWT